MFTITTQTRAAGKKGLWHCKSMTKLISVTITPLNWACCFHLQERLSSYFTFSFLQHSKEGSYSLEEFHDDSEQACALWWNRYTSCKEATINFEKYSAKQSSIFSALSNCNKQRNVFPATFNKDSHLHYCKEKKTEKSQQGETEFPWHLIFFKKSK